MRDKTTPGYWFVGLRMKRHDYWSVPPAIWLALIGRPSTKRTPSINAAWDPLQRAQKVDLDQWRRQVADWKSLRPGLVVVCGSGAGLSHPAAFAQNAIVPNPSMVGGEVTKCFHLASHAPATYLADFCDHVSHASSPSALPAVAA